MDIFLLELQDGSSRSEEEEEETEEEGKEDIDNIHDNESSNSYTSALTTMDWGWRSHPEYQEDYWIGDGGASSHMVGEDKRSFCKDSHLRKSECCLWHINAHGVQNQDECGSNSKTGQVKQTSLVCEGGQRDVA